MSSRILVLLSIAFGVTIALFAVFGWDGIGIFSFLGAMALGLLWVARALFAKRPGRPSGS